MRFRTTALLLAAALLVPAWGRAQGTTTAVGVVQDAAGNPVPDVKVLLDYKGHIVQKYRTKTDKTGRFVHVNVYSGVYDVTLSKEGVGEVMVKGFTFQDLQSTERPPVLRFVVKKAAPPPVATGSVVPAVTTESLQAELSQANQNLAAGRVDEAIAGYEAVLAQAQDVGAVHRLLGLAWKKKGDLARAEAELRKAVELDPQDSGSHRDLSVLLYDSGRGPEALAEGEKAVAAAPGNASLLFNLGLMYQNAGRSQEAWDALVKAEAADPQNADLQYHLGTVALGLGKTDESLKRLEAYLAMSPANAQNVASAKGLIAALAKKK